MLIFALYTKSCKIYTPDLVKNMTIDNLKNELNINKKLLEEIIDKGEYESLKKEYEKNISILKTEIERR